jgi:hypothetical protein
VTRPIIEKSRRQQIMQNKTNLMKSVSATNLKRRRVKKQKEYTQIFCCKVELNMQDRGSMKRE